MPAEYPVEAPTRFTHTNPENNRRYLLFKQKTNAVIISVALLGLIGIIASLWFTKYRLQSTLTQVSQQSNTPPASRATSDPPEGSSGDFTVEMKKGNNTVVGWDTSIQVSGVTVYDLGTKNTTEDNTIVFASSFVNPDKLQEQIQQQLKQNPKEKLDIKLPPPTTYFPNPYTVGTIPQGYFNLTPDNQKPTPETLFQSGKRYSVEVSGIKDTNNSIKAQYVFKN